MAINGSDILLLVNTGTAAVPVYEAVGSQRDVTFDEATEEIDVSSKDSRAKRVLPGRYSASLSLDALYVWSDDGYQALRDAMRDGELILVARQDDGVTMETADALITSLSESFPDQGEGTISISMTVDGFWTELVS
jgi:TP901-1 family phage major tail protein